MCDMMKYDFLELLEEIRMETRAKFDDEMWIHGRLL